MKHIPLTKGYEAMVDDEDFDRVSKLKWSVDQVKHLNYATSRSMGRKKIYMHRFVMGIEDRGCRVDHKDRDGLNNTKGNLRLATQAQNCANRRRPVGANNPYRGVSFDGYRWCARLKTKRKNLFLGNFISPEDAARAYDAKARELFGEFASTNF